MEPENNNLNTESLEPTQELVPESVNEPSQLGDKVDIKPTKHEDNKMVIMVIVLAILALVGIVFGIVMAAMNVGKNEIAIEKFENPVIKNAANIGEWSEIFDGTAVYVDGGTKNVSMVLKDGEIESCSIQGFAEISSEDGKEITTDGFTTECVVSGLINDVYKIVEFGKGLTPEEDYIGFIMTDGKVYYVKMVDAIANNDFAVKGPLNIDDYVVDIINVDVAPTDDNLSGGISAVLVLRDGSIVEFSESMIK